MIEPNCSNFRIINYSNFSDVQIFKNFTIQNHTCHKLWIKICVIRQIFKGDLIKFCEIFTKITLELPQNSQKPVFKCKKLVINTTKCDLCLFLQKMCCKMVWKFCEIWESYGNWLPDGPNSVRFYLAVWDMACMQSGSCFLCVLTLSSADSARCSASFLLSSRSFIWKYMK